MFGFSLNKVLMGALVLLILGSGVIWWQLSRKSENKPSFSASQNIGISDTTSGSQILRSSGDGISIESRINSLETTVRELLSQVKTAPAGTTTSPTTLESRVKTLETSILDLQSRVKTLETRNTTSTISNSTTSSTKSPVLVPLNWTGTTTATDWVSVGSLEVSFSGSDYPGYTNIQFQISLKTGSNGGTAYARIFNKDDNKAVAGSEVSTTSTNYTFVTSGYFTLPNVTKTYYLQMKSNAEHEATAQNAWVRVVY